MDMVLFIGLVIIKFILDNGKEDFLMVQVFTWEKINMKVIFLMDLNLDLGRKLFPMGINI